MVDEARFEMLRDRVAALEAMLIKHMNGGGHTY